MKDPLCREEVDRRTALIALSFTRSSASGSSVGRSLTEHVCDVPEVVGEMFVFV